MGQTDERRGVAFAPSNGAKRTRRACRKERIVMNPDFAWCLEEHPQWCPFSMVFGAAYLCCRALADKPAQDNAGLQPPAMPSVGREIQAAAGSRTVLLPGGIPPAKNRRA